MIESNGPLADGTTTEVTDCCVSNDLDVAKKNIENLSLDSGKIAGDSVGEVTMTEPSDFFSLGKTVGKIKDGAFGVVESTFDTGTSLVQGVLDTGKGFAKEVGTIRSGKEGEDTDGPAMTEPSDFFSPKKFAKGGRSLVEKTFATGEAGVRAGVNLGKETIGGVRKFGTGLLGKLGIKKKDDTPSMDENNGETKSE